MDIDGSALAIIIDYPYIGIGIDFVLGILIEWKIFNSVMAQTRLTADIIPTELYL